ncbi:MAG: RNA methyltransferase [Clostridia bacterium]|nr:RNA methyltransferase [Clostridia bacterium]
MDLIFEGLASLRPLLEDGHPRKILRMLIADANREKKPRDVGYVLARSRALDFPVEWVSKESLDKMCQGKTHGGFAAVVESLPLRQYDGNPEVNGFYLYLEGLEDPYNFGNILRSFYAFGGTGVLLSKRNWTEAAGTVARASYGASERLPMYECDPETVFPLFKNAGYKILGASLRDSVSLAEADLSLPLILVVGGEKRGISSSVLSLCDSFVRIEYGRPSRASLSSATAASVLAYEIFRRNQAQ